VITQLYQFGIAIKKNFWESHIHCWSNNDQNHES